MSRQAVRDFWQKAQGDPALRQQLEGVTTDDKEAAIAAVVKIAAAAGFTFTAADYEAALKEALAREYAVGQLQEEQLQQAVGGALTYAANGCAIAGGGSVR
jgi:predicted ribosomally synthesized peptide with nif11-like leader